MFLDDKLEEITSFYNLDKNDDIFECSKACMNACIDNYKERLGEKPTDAISDAQLKRVNRTWKAHVEKLEKKGFSVFRSDAFENLIKRVTGHSIA